MSSFIKDVLLPEKVKSYYIFSKIVIGIEINKTKIIATKTRISATVSMIEEIIEEKITEEVSVKSTSNVPESKQQLVAESVMLDQSEQTDSASTNTIAAENKKTIDPVSQALVAILKRVGKYDEIHTVLPSSIVVFKELKLPFVSRDKISMVIGFEIEPLLPFPLREAIIDFIITREIPEEKSSEIIVTAVQKQHMINHIALFEAAGVNPTVITVDMICVYGLYRHIDAYKNIQGGAALISITSHSTAIAFMVDGQLKTVRTISKGMVAFTKQITQQLNNSSTEIIDYLLRFGVEESGDNAEYTAIIQKVISEWWDAVNFTLVSFSGQLLNRQPITKIIFLGNGALIKGLITFIAQKTNSACELFTTQDVIQNPICTVKNSNIITPLTVISASSTLPLPIIVDYNLKQKEFATQDDSLLLRQGIVLAFITIVLFALLISHYFIQTNKLQKAVYKSEQHVLNALVSTFKDLENAKKLDEELIDDARAELEEKQKRWFAFSQQSRASILQYLLELSSKIDRKSIGLIVEQITIGEGILTLKAEVKDYEALKTFERELEQSQLFAVTEAPPETPQFTMRLTLVNKEELS